MEACVARNLSRHIYIIDSTLREGVQAAGSCLRPEHALPVARALYRLGLRHVELANPLWNPDWAGALASIAAQMPDMELICWCRAKAKDIEAALDIGPGCIHLSFPVSPAMIEAKLHLPETGLPAFIRSVIEEFSWKGQRFSIGAEDASRADPGLLAEVAAVAKQMGAVRLRYADTVSQLNPASTQARLKELMLRVPQTEVFHYEFHAHNDFGLGLANAIAALEAGVRAVSSTLCGLGERAGNAATEQLLAYLELHPQSPEGWQGGDIDLSGLPELCAQVAEFSGKLLASQAPIVGADVFTHESGLHVDGIIKNSQLYDAMAPERLGRSNQLRPSAKAGAAARRYFAASSFPV
ncbi:MAG: hypothetical protein EA428_09645 [Spirochaetaceae bacterium]|nr:MAG: hypothetical protein EA428_09645 [Spirochaetaceae bacterium]